MIDPSDQEKLRRIYYQIGASVSTMKLAIDRRPKHMGGIGIDKEEIALAYQKAQAEFGAAVERVVGMAGEAWKGPDRRGLARMGQVRLGRQWFRYTQKFAHKRASC